MKILDKLKNLFIGKEVEIFSYNENPTNSFVFLHKTERNCVERPYSYKTKIVDIKQNLKTSFNHQYNFILENGNYYFVTINELRNVYFLNGTNGYFMGSLFNVLHTDFEGHFIIYFKLDGSFEVSKIGDFERLTTIANKTEGYILLEKTDSIYEYFYPIVLNTISKMKPKYNIYMKKVEADTDYIRVDSYLLFNRRLNFDKSYEEAKKIYQEKIDILNSFLNPNTDIFY